MELHETTWSDHRLIDDAAPFIALAAGADASHLNTEPVIMHMFWVLIKNDGP